MKFYVGDAINVDWSDNGLKGPYKITEISKQHKYLTMIYLEGLDATVVKSKLAPSGICYVDFIRTFIERFL